MTDIRAIIFDLDGVICSTDRYHYLAWKSLADQLGIPFDEQKNKLLRGVSRMDSLEIILGDRSSHFSEQEKWELAEEKNRIYREYLQTMRPSDLSEDSRYTLQTLRKRGLSSGNRLFQQEYPADFGPAWSGTFLRCRCRRNTNHPVQTGPGSILPGCFLTGHIPGAGHRHRGCRIRRPGRRNRTFSGHWNSVKGK